MLLRYSFISFVLRGLDICSFQLLQVDLLLSFCSEMGFSSVVLIGHDDGGLLALKAAQRAQASMSSVNVSNYFILYSKKDPLSVGRLKLQLSILAFSSQMFPLSPNYLPKWPCCVKGYDVGNALVSVLC